MRWPTLSSRAVSFLVLGSTLSGMALAAAACKGIEPSGACDWLHSPATSDNRTAVLVDVSSSTRSVGAPKLQPDYVQATADARTAAIKRGDIISVAAFSAGDDLDWSARDRNADWRSADDNPANQEDLRTAAEACLSDDIAEALRTQPRSGGTDILGAIRVASAWLSSAKGGRHLVVATDGLVTTGCANLVRSGFSSPAEPDAISSACVQAKELKPGELAGIDVELVGLGHPAADQPVPTAAQADWLDNLWHKLCATASAKSCTVQTTSVTGDGKGTASAPPPDTAMADPVVPFGPGNVTVYSMPSAALFDTGRSVVRSEAEPLLVRIAVSIRTSRHNRIEVKGYADPRGSAGDNQELSAARAKAVADILTANGVDNVHPEGAGETTVCPYAMDLPPNASEDDKLQCFRRVDIVVS